MKGKLKFIESFSALSFVLSYMASDKNRPFLILYKKYRMSSCTSCLKRNTDTPMSLATGLIKLLGSLSRMTWMSPTNSWVHLSEQSEGGFRAAAPFVIMIGFLPFQTLSMVLRLTPKHSEIFELYFPAWMSSVHHGISKFLEKWIASWNCFLQRQGPTHSCLQHRSQNLKNKKTKQKQIKKKSHAPNY